MSLQQHAFESQLPRQISLWILLVLSLQYNIKLENTIHCKTALPIRIISNIRTFVWPCNSKCSLPCCQHVILIKPNLTFRLDLHSIQCQSLLSAHRCFVFIYFVLQNFELVFIQYYTLLYGSEKWRTLIGW